MLRKKIRECLISRILFLLCIYYSPTIFAHSQPTSLNTSGLFSCFTSIKFKFLGGQLNYTTSQETIERFLGVWGIGCYVLHTRVVTGFDLQFGTLKVTHTSPSFNADLELPEISIRPWIEVNILNYSRWGVVVRGAWETLFTTQQTMNTSYLDASIGLGNLLELTSFTKSETGKPPLISPFGYFNILELTARWRFSLLPQRLNITAAIGYRRYAVSIFTTLSGPIEILLAASNHTSDEFKKDIVLNAVECTPGITWAIIPQRLYFIGEGMILPISLDSNAALSFFYGGNIEINLLWH